MEPDESKDEEQSTAIVHHPLGLLDDNGLTRNTEPIEENSYPQLPQPALERQDSNGSNVERNEENSDPDREGGDPVLSQPALERQDSNGSNVLRNKENSEPDIEGGDPVLSQPALEKQDSNGSNVVRNKENSEPDREGGDPVLLQTALVRQDSNGSNVVRRKGLGVATDLEEDLACSVCLQLAVQPTTLVCGHTSCRVCLAKWYFTSKTKVCPLCRQTYHGLPMVNVQIRNMIRKLYPEKAKEREEELGADDEGMSLVVKYDEELRRERRSSSSGDTDMASFCAGILIAICSFVVIYLAWYWQSSDKNLLVLKPVQTWKPKDVFQWVEELTWAQAYSSAVFEENIDGNMILSLTESDLQPIFNMTDPMHQKAFLFAIDLLREDGIKMPANLWEYKAIYPGRSLFLAFSLKDFPRTSLLYMYVYFYDDMFLPFVRISTRSDSSQPLQASTQSEDISLGQWISFFVYALLVPEWLVIVFALQMFSHHFFSPLFVIATGTLYQVLEYLQWISLFRNLTPRSLYEFLRLHMKQLVSAFIFMVLWPIIPSLICDIFFYGVLYISPVQASMAVYNKFTALNNF